MMLIILDMIYNGITNTRIHKTILGTKSQWVCGLRHELSLSARTLGSWVRIPIKAWMSVLGNGLATG
jgi:hypothetical protein